MDLATRPPFSPEIPTAQDALCSRCGYNLRGLPASSRCPECGMPIDYPTREDLLRFADPIWAANLARGMKIITWMIIVSFLAQLVGGFLVRWTSLVNGVNVSVAAFHLYGVWLVTAPDPAATGQDTHRTARFIVRVALLIGIIGTLGRSMPQAGLDASNMFFAQVSITTTGVINLVGEFLKFQFCERIGRRVIDERLPRSVRRLQWGFVVCWGATLGGTLAMAIMTILSSVKQPPAAFIHALWMGGCMLLVLSLWTLVVLVGLRAAVMMEVRESTSLGAPATLIADQLVRSSGEK